MTKINWLVRIKNKYFWVTLIPALLILIQAVASVFGFSIDLAEFGGKMEYLVEAVFAVLVILGIVVDPTTEGVTDSNLALTYEEPRKDR